MFKNLKLRLLNLYFGPLGDDPILNSVTHGKRNIWIVNYDRFYITFGFQGFFNIKQITISFPLYSFWWHWKIKKMIWLGPIRINF